MRVEVRMNDDVKVGGEDRGETGVGGSGRRRVREKGWWTVGCRRDQQRRTSRTRKRKEDSAFMKYKT